MLKVIKFGGTSVGSVKAIKNVQKIINTNLKEKHKQLIICSAMSGITNKLLEAGQLAQLYNSNYKKILEHISDLHIEIIHQLIGVVNQSNTIIKIKVLLNQLDELLHGVFLLGELSGKSQDLILSFGEQLSCIIISDYLIQNNIPAKFVDARLLIKTDNQFTNAKVNFKATNTNLDNFIENLDYIPIITGFIASSSSNETTTLGRGGSDYTASIIGAGINANAIEIWTDVDGVMSANPKVVKTAHNIEYLTYQEAMELSHFGAKIIYSPTIYPACVKNIPLYIKNTFNPKHLGTLITNVENIKTQNNSLIKGISSISEMAILNIEGSNMVGIPGVMGKITTILANNNINVILLTQASSEHSICIVVSQSDAKIAESTLNKEFSQDIKTSMLNKIVAENGYSIISVIGGNMKSHSGLAGKFFMACGKNGINIRAIAQGSSELNISAVIASDMLNKALNTVHEAFFGQNDYITLNLFMIGVGLIGGTLIHQLSCNRQYLLKSQNLKINIVGLANTKNMLIDVAGINTESWQNTLTNAPLVNLEKFVHTMQTLNLSNTVFVDCTSNKKIANFYSEILASSIAITTPNKVANSGSYTAYLNLQNLAQRYNTKYLYETNVGAGLPIINTLQNLKLSGDRIIKIEGVLSGTLSFIFNNFTGDKQFSKIVREAKAKGYTEPDPRSDLSGLDVARKILILARESGAELEMDDIKLENILPKECLNANTIDEFFISLEQHNDYFETLKQKAEKSGKKLRMIASYTKNQAEVKLKSVDQNHPFYNLQGSDNIIAFTTERYKDQPLVVQGPGAGAEVTASGIFAEVISIAKFFKG
ncbi:MAG: bifunctional aspartate kinase/homoserine dehydrogenase I [Burkholderiales bacterium]|nr:bifunctional aspartate kinase/homoserine dehydrogenase I [Burkholderiales bacterium]